MSVDKSFIISTEHMSPLLLAQNNLFPDDTKIASDHFPVIVDYKIPMIHSTGFMDKKVGKDVINIKDLLGRDVDKIKNTLIFYIYDNGTVEKRIVIE